MKLWFLIGNGTLNSIKFLLTWKLDQSLFNLVLITVDICMIRCEIVVLCYPLFFAVARHHSSIMLIIIIFLVCCFGGWHTLEFLAPIDLWPRWSVHLGLGSRCACSPSLWLVPDLEWQSAHTQLLGEFCGSLSLSGDRGCLSRKRKTMKMMMMRRRERGRREEKEDETHYSLYDCFFCFFTFFAYKALEVICWLQKFSYDISFCKEFEGNLFLCM